MSDTAKVVNNLSDSVLKIGTNGGTRKSVLPIRSKTTMNFSQTRVSTAAISDGSACPASNFPYR
ncbi:hypothetical protein [Fodinibius sp.]|uniref:hypothetical protein n=1 Tax=Fodinibius sp. TaxID=1872440 RepID=UPI002ACD7233|nr:hypothetical protein [Fodinibius sp.]MDZ7658833.1 hypothetical protein [Fodinibius sp.]